MHLVLLRLLLLDLEGLEHPHLHPLGLLEALGLQQLLPPRHSEGVVDLERLPLRLCLVLLHRLRVDFLGRTLPQHPAACLARHRPHHRVASAARLLPLGVVVSELLHQLQHLGVVQRSEPRLQLLQGFLGRVPLPHLVVLVDSVLRPPALLELRLQPHRAGSLELLPRLRHRAFLVLQRHRWRG